MSNNAGSLSLQQKVSVTLLTVMVLLAFISYGILDAQVAPAFENLELKAAHTNVVRAQRAIGADLDNLVTVSNDWSIWDDAYAYMTGRYPGFTNSNLKVETLVTLEMDLMLFYELSGELKWGKFLLDEQPQELASLGILGENVQPTDFLLNHRELDDAIRGVIATDKGPMLIASKPILTTAATGPISGTLIMGRFLDEDHQARLRERTEVDFMWHGFDEHSSADDAQLIGALRNEPLTIHHEQTADAVVSHSVINDLFGEPLLVLHATTPRQISALGNQTLNGALLFLAIAAVVVAIVTWLLLRSIVVLPMERLATHIISVRQSGDLSSRLEMQRDDEIGALAQEFDKLTGEVSEARQLLLDQSFMAGRADTAAEVMHNIRNAMTPLINGIDRLGNQLRIAAGLKIKQATHELAQSGGDAERREKLLLYIDSAFDRILETNEASAEELKTASKQARQVEAILADQERHAKAAPVIENLDLDEVLTEAMLVIPKRKKPQIDVDVPPNVEGIKVRGHRVGLLQVLGNVILNAYEAIQRSELPSGTICLSAQHETVEDRDMVRLTVRDSGCGFSEAEQQKIFQRGYSSKQGNMSGLGLHWCANAVAGMGGRIFAESTGEGHGAEFHLLLPSA